MVPEEVDVNQLAREVKHLRREMDEMKKLLRSLLQEIVESNSGDEEDFFDFN